MALVARLNAFSGEFRLLGARPDDGLESFVFRSVCAFFQIAMGHFQGETALPDPSKFGADRNKGML